MRMLGKFKANGAAAASFKHGVTELAPTFQFETAIQRRCNLA
jgi:hypothetical protein